MSSSNKNTLPELLDEMVAEMKQIDNNLTQLETLLNQIEEKYVEMEKMLESLKNQIK